MADFSGGVTYQVNPAGADIPKFDLINDRLDFGEISVHGLILGSLVDGTAVIVNPWADPVQTQALQGLRWSDLSLDNFGVVGNEHLRQDIGGCCLGRRALANVTRIRSMCDLINLGLRTSSVALIHKPRS